MDTTVSFHCRFCNFISSSLRAHLSHYKQHRHLTKFFHCGLKNCQLAFRTEASLRSHVLRKHNIHVSQIPLLYSHGPVNQEAKYICTVDCCRKEFLNQRVFFGHLKVHIKSGILTKCPFNDCTTTFNSISSFTGHISRRHRHDSYAPNINEISSGVDVSLTEIETDCENVGPPNCETGDEINVDASLISLAQFYLKLECKYFVPESTVQYIAEELKTLFMNTEGFVKSKLEHALEIEGVDPVVSEKVLTSLEDAITFSVHSFHLRSIYKRRKFYKKHFNFVQPEEKPLGKNHFLYVPIAKTLDACLRSKSFSPLSSCCNCSSNSDCLKDFTDGEAFKNNTYFKENPEAFKLLLYQDSFEIVCPISPSAKRKYKILAVYLAFGDLPPEERFKKDAIQLVALCREKYFSHNKVYGQIVADIKKLETEGVYVQGRGLVKAGLAFIAGDNLGSHSLAGLNENFSFCKYFCRYCLVDRESFHKDGGECRDYPFRTKQSYDDALTKVTTNEKKQIIPYHGIKFNSSFNSLDSFHVCMPGLPPCLGHDLQEGIIAYDLLLFIKYFIKQKWFTLEDLNILIENFPYSEDDKKDRPVPIPTQGKKLAGGAWQLWTFMKVFPLMVKRLIKDCNDPVWLCLPQLIEICEIVTAPEICKSHLFYLKEVIQDYLINRKSLFPEENLKPKHHYLSHYAELTLSFGPLIKVWTLRFESKHTFFKRAWKASHNTKNVLSTVGNKHELLQAFVRSGSEIPCPVVTSEMRSFDACLYSRELLSAIHSTVSFVDLKECSSVTVNGTQYRKGYVLVLNHLNFDHVLEIGQVCLLLVDSDLNVKFVVRLGRANLNSILRAYEIVYEENFKCVAPHELIMFYPLHRYELDTVPFIRLRHALVGDNKDTGS